MSISIKRQLKKPVFTGLFWGIIGGVILIIVTNYSTNGYLQISPYPFLLILSILSINHSSKSKIAFNKLFITGLLTFLIMTVFLYLYIILLINPGSKISFWGHLWRIHLMIAIGSVSSFFISIFVWNFRKWTTE